MTLDPCANPFEGMTPEIPHPSISFNYADGSAAVLAVDDWTVDLQAETRDARPTDPEYSDIFACTVLAGRTTGIIHFTITSENYRP